MRLERLEISGFKSFSDRSELAFDRGVTAIVGPNGCGKSNVADAITWVMGEQSAKSLRGERMEDVIFSGSDARKPTATAEVRLRFSDVVKQVVGPAFTAEANGHALLPLHANGNGNGNGHSNGNGHVANGNGHDLHGLPPFPVVAVGAVGQDEASTLPEFAAIALPEEETVLQSVARDVELTRRLYRSGESEYLIDGQVCRLRDIHDLLMDTGLGAKAYAIIEQGKIGLILSSRPTDRRQLIEEAAGVTKYKSRRRAADLKLEAARQNLTRIDDIVFEVEKQRGTLKRQAGKARRYTRLRNELRRWEKVLLARRYRQLAESIESARTRLGDARERESLASAHVAALESDLGRVRIELVEVESRATGAREAAHARELEIIRLEQQTAFDKEQSRTLDERATAIAAEVDLLAARREPARAALAARRTAATEAGVLRDDAAAALSARSDDYGTAHREIEGLEADVEASRSEVFSAINSATALRHSLEHAATARDRVLEVLSKLQVEVSDARIESDRVAGEREAAQGAMRRVQEALEATVVARTARESELASARIEHEWRARSIRTREHEVAALDARLQSLRELETARAGYGDAPRAVLAQANGQVCQQGAVADYLEVEAGYERAVEACLGDLLQHVIVEHPEHAAAGLRLIDEQQAGRCGFLIASEESSVPRPSFHTVSAPPDGLVALSSVLGITGRFVGAIQTAVGEAWIADSYDRAAQASATTALTVVTRRGEVFRGPHVVSGGTPAEARGILETRRDMRELQARIDGERAALDQLTAETGRIEASIAEAMHAIAALGAEHHRHEKAMVGHEAQLQRASEETTRLAQKVEQLARERRQSEEERETLDRREAEARDSITHLEVEQRSADERFTNAQRRLFEAREAAEDLARLAADAGASHAALVERATALSAEVRRLEEAAAELESRDVALTLELGETRQRIDALRMAVAEGERRLAEDVRLLEGLHQDVMQLDEAVAALRLGTDERELAIRTARTSLDELRTAVAELDVTRATAESDLAHLAAACVDSVQATLDEVMVEVSALEEAGGLTPDVRVICADEGDDASDGDVQVEAESSDRAVSPVNIAGGEAERQTLSAEDAIAALRAKIDRLGPVNILAIEQFDELESRHSFLTTQRKDLLDSIAQTSEAIKRIEETTRHRFSEAFAAINRHFQEIFSTLFGGGRASLTLLDEQDPMESGIEIIAQPPGKRLQSVQLLSGGEKALTAISLMFALFKYKPSPFCLLDEIDAPLDDANIGRFVEMLRSMQAHTQFILITHNRKTMEIADRLYGVTMEEPGVSKLISVQLN